MDLLLWGTDRVSLNVIKIIHVPCSKTRYHMYSNSCTVMRYNNIQTCGNPRTFWPSPACPQYAFSYGDINDHRRYRHNYTSSFLLSHFRNISLKTKMKFCNRCSFCNHRIIFMITIFTLLLNLFNL